MFCQVRFHIDPVRQDGCPGLAYRAEWEHACMARTCVLFHIASQAKRACKVHTGATGRVLILAAAWHPYAARVVLVEHTPRPVIHNARCSFTSRYSTPFIKTSGTEQCVRLLSEQSFPSPSSRLRPQLSLRLQRRPELLGHHPPSRLGVTRVRSLFWSLDCHADAYAQILGLGPAPPRVPL